MPRVAFNTFTHYGVGVIPDGEEPELHEFYVRLGDRTVVMNPADLVVVEADGAVAAAPERHRLEQDGSITDIPPVLPEPEPVTTEDRAKATERINKEAGQARQAFVTSIPGQEATYLRKLAEAQAKSAGGSGPFPYLEREAFHTGKTADDVATEILATAELWDKTVNPEIEGLRRGRLEAARAAVTKAELDALFPIGWPVPEPASDPDPNPDPEPAA